MVLKVITVGKLTKKNHFMILRPLESFLVELMKPGQLVHHYLLSSLAYYHYDESPFEDSGYERICERLLECFDALVHPHKHIIEKDSLQAGTGYYIKFDDYPSIVRNGIHIYARRINDGSLQADIIKFAGL